jgi:hypothetical protein
MERRTDQSEIRLIAEGVERLAPTQRVRRHRPRAPQPAGASFRAVGSLDASATVHVKDKTQDDQDEQERQRSLPLSDFIAHSPDHSYIHRPTGEMWSMGAVNARVMPVGKPKPISASTWLDRNNAVEQQTWLPGEPQIIEDKLVVQGGFIDKKGARAFNLYRPPEIITSNNGEIAFWRDHLHALWPDEADQIEQWFAHRAQRPGEKINHALVLGGHPGVGKDAILDPLRLAVGAWNFAEVSPQTVLGNFNEYVRSVVLRISEGKDLGDFDRFAFHDATKTLIAAPPDTLRVNPKYVKPYYVFNVTGVIITTNHKVGGIYLPPDDRRHFVLWSNVEPPAFGADYWLRYWARLEEGGRDAVAAHLKALDLNGFNPKAEPPKTQAFWEMVNAMRSEEESEMADVIEGLGSPKALIVADLIAYAEHVGSRYDAFVAFLKDRKNARLIAIRFEDCRYRRFANPSEQAGRWSINGRRIPVFIRQDLSDREGFQAVKDLSGS